MLQCVGMVWMIGRDVEDQVEFRESIESTLLAEEILTIQTEIAGIGIVAHC